MLVTVNRAVVIALMGTMAVLVFANVITRYLFNSSIIWVEELTQFQMIWITYLGAGLALREGRHVAVDTLQDLLPTRFQRYARVLIWTAMFGFLIALTVLGFMMSAFTWDQETPVLNVRTGIPYLAIPIGALLLAMHLVLIARDFVEKQFEHADDLEAYSE
jgi:TRAP-type C4-dicarboxylate transport system permease small subunit